MAREKLYVLHVFALLNVYFDNYTVKKTADEETYLEIRWWRASFRIIFIQITKHLVDLSKNLKKLEPKLLANF